MHFDTSLPHIADEKDPVTLGHECSGSVVAMGSDVVGFQLGDHVGVFPVVGCCFKCPGCQVHNLYCETGKTAIPGFAVDGFFQEYSVVEQRCAIVLPEKIPVHIAAPIFCAGITSWNGVRNCELKKGEWLAVIGCGGLGHLGMYRLSLATLV
jgi:propanol-preferring alcohol dehydrogenase